MGKSFEDKFKTNSRSDFISFFGKYPRGKNQISIEKNGLLYGMLSKLDEKRKIIPVFGSYDVRDDNVSFSMIHVPSENILRYTSNSTYRGVGIDGYEDIYSEALAVENSCLPDEFEKRLKGVSFLKRDFLDLVKSKPSRVAPEGDVKEILELQDSIYCAMDNGFFD